MSLQALIWDVDGTLAETEDDGHRVAFNRAFEDAGLPWYWDSAVYADLLAVTGGKERLQAWWQGLDPAAAQADGAAEIIRALHARKTVHYIDMLARGSIALRPGVADLLAQAQAAGLRQAIATTTTLDNVLQLVDLTLGPNGRGLFECIGAGDVVAHKKPAPDIYLWVLGQLGLPASDCLAIEDSVPGVLAARGAALPVLLVRSRYTGTVRIDGAVADLPSLHGTGLGALCGWHARAGDQPDAGGSVWVAC